MKLAHRSRFSPGPRTLRERGAVLVEFAIVASFLVTLLAGTFDFGMGWRASLAVTEGARGGARVGSSVGPVADADRSILTSLQATLASSNLLGKVERVVIFSAAGTNGKPSTACINGTGGTCNTFTGAQFRAVTSASALDANFCITGSTRRGYCPKNRNNVQLTADYLGVWVRVRYDYNFKLLGNSLMIERSAVMRIEPADIN